MRLLRVALAQINTTVGDLDGNARKVGEAVGRARDLGADLVAFPELAITGYPPEDLVLSRAFVADNRARLDELASSIEGIAAIVGFVGGGKSDGGPVCNSAALVANGKIVHVYKKIYLPNYGVFDEARYFQAGFDCPVFEIAGTVVGMNICEDVWKPVGPSEIQCAAGAEVIVNINASPYEMGKLDTRRRLIGDLARRNAVYALYVNQVGGQDELVFDGGSLLYGPDGKVVAEAARFEEDLLLADLDLAAVQEARAAQSPVRADEDALAAIGRPFQIARKLPAGTGRKRSLPARTGVLLGESEEVYRALVVGTRDYVAKTGFSKVMIALSGGVDSTLTAVVAVDALGPENVVGLAMPSRYSSEGSVLDARELASRLGIELWTVPIEQAHQAFEQMLAERFAGTQPNTAEENVQARVRGNVMMTVSNKFGWLVLTTGNKSEMATGYATLYGDMAGGFAVLKDVPKTLVYRLCEYRNRADPGRPIPQSVIDKPPSAELRPDQLDADSLPPYQVLDRILERYVEQRLPASEIVELEASEGAQGADQATVRRVVQMVDRNEYKRRQAPPGVKITGLAFGRDRRLPIASRYRG